MKFKYLIIALIVAGIGISVYFLVQNSEEEQRPTLSPKEIQENLVKLNQMHHEEEEETIDAYVNRLNIPFVKTPSGLRIYKESDTLNSLKPAPKDEVKYAYICKNLAGDTIYDSSHKGLGFSRIEYDNSIRGLHEGLQKIGLGEKATFIIPSHLAHGLHGDNDKIGPWLTLVYNIEIVEIKKNEENSN